MNIAIAVLVTLIFCQFAYYFKWLDGSGALAAAIMGVTILIAGSWLLALPMLLFFITGSILGRLRKDVTVSDRKSKKPRAYIQVLSNGGIAIGCLLLHKWWQSDAFLTAYYVSIAVSTADTWSSEIGVWCKGEVIDIIGFKKMNRGLSGGISIAGTFAGFAGALAIAILFYWSDNTSVSLFVMVMAGGIAGMLLDSVIGSRFQARYCKSDGTYAEFADRNESARLDKGFKWMTNDLVNMLSNLVITGITIMQLLLF